MVGPRWWKSNMLKIENVENCKCWKLEKLKIEKMLKIENDEIRNRWKSNILKINNVEKNLKSI